MTILACSEAIFAPPNVRVSITPSLVQLQRLDSARVTVTITDSGGGDTVGRAFVFSVGDPTLVSVNPSGVVRSLGPLGSTFLAVTIPSEGHASDTAHVTVGTTATRVTLVPPDTLVAPLSQVHYRGMVFDAHGAVPGDSFALTTGLDSNIATPIGGESVASLGPVGDVVVTATIGLGIAKAALTVLDNPGANRVAATGHPGMVATSALGLTFVARLGRPFLSRYNAGTHLALASVLVPTGVSAIAVDSTGTRVYYLSSLAAWGLDPSQAAVTDTFYTGSQPTALLVSPDGHFLLVSTIGDELLAFDRTTHGLVHTIAAATLSRLASSPDGDSLTYGIAGGSIVEINTRTFAVGRTFSVGGSLTDIAVSADGHTLFAADAAAHRVSIWSLTNGTVADSILLGGAPQDIAVAADGAQLWVTIPGLGEALVFDPVTDSLVRTVTTGGSPRGVGIGPAGTFAVIANDSGWIDAVAR